MLVGDALGVWFGMVRFCAKRRESTKLPKKWQCIWHFWANWRGSISEVK